MVSSSEPVARVGVAHGKREKAKTDGQHDDIQHKKLLATAISSTMKQALFHATAL
jgi:hypothetical protein